MKLHFAMNHLGALLLVLTALSCSSDEEPGTATGNLVGALGKANRPSPAGADRIDRAGRPAISAALISTFAPDARQADLDRYNRSGNANPDFVPIMAQSLAILDGLDGECGNQLGVNPDLANPYAPLARTLSDDQIYVQSDREGVGSVYLGVEGEALGVLDRGRGSGGGRVPGDDVVARSYSVLVAGQLSGIDDLVGSDDAEHDIDVFPFLAAPQP
jgi:hypothetical protein